MAELWWAVRRRTGGTIADGPLKGSHGSGHDGGLEDSQPDLGEDFSGEDVQCRSRLPDHLRLHNTLNTSPKMGPRR